MLGGAGLRWSGIAISNGRQRLIITAPSHRLLSSHSGPVASAPFRVAQNRTIPFHSPSWRSVKSATARQFHSSPARLASTPPNPPASSVVTPPTQPTYEEWTAPTSTSSSSVEDIVETIPSISDIPEKIGYLKELGLDYGWGPSAFMQFTLEHIHIWTGMPWWASIIMLAVLIRAALLKSMLQASDTSAKLQTILPITQPIRDRMTQARLQQDTLTVMKCRQEYKDIMTRAGIQWWKAFVPMIQIFLGFGSWRVIGGMSRLPVPALENESLLWLNDLTLGDPYWILPCATAGLTYVALKGGGDTGNTALQDSALGKAMVYGLPTMSLLIMLQWPGALQLYFFASSILIFIQSRVVSNPQFRRWANLTPLAPRRPKNPDDPNAGLNVVRNPFAVEEKKASFIDRTVDSVKETGRGMVKEAREKMTGKGKTEDGKKERRTRDERREAKAYEKRRREEIEWERAERNERNRRKM